MKITRSTAIPPTRSAINPPIGRSTLPKSDAIAAIAPTLTLSTPYAVLKKIAR
jgi:hypothetical protein